MVLVLLLLTSGRDPGIVPRNAHPPEPENYEGSNEVGVGQTPELHLPRIKDVVVNGITVKVKYCDTCMLYRPHCVERFDHHCPWVGQCVGLHLMQNFTIEIVDLMKSEGLYASQGGAIILSHIQI